MVCRPPITIVYTIHVDKMGLLYSSDYYTSHTFFYIHFIAIKILFP
jgi:hypothetical protein